MAHEGGDNKDSKGDDNKDPEGNNIRHKMSKNSQMNRKNEHANECKQSQHTGVHIYAQPQQLQQNEWVQMSTNEGQTRAKQV